MEIIKKINNNIALARDAKGREMVVFGKGIGFPATPYTLQDLSKVQRTFYDVNDKYFSLLQEVPEEIFLAAERQLKQTKLSIAQISERFGFCDQFYFSRRFRARYGLSPQQYRKRYPF